MSGLSAVNPRSDTTPGTVLPSGIDERFLDAGGVRFRYLSGGSGDGVPIILLHGWPTWAEVWLPVVSELGGRHPWIAPDLPCQGQSSLLPKGNRTLPSYRAAITAFLDALEIPRFAIVGNSMGGTLAIMACLERPGKVDRLVVLDAAGLTPRLPGRTARMYLPFLFPCYFRAPGPGSVQKLLTRAVFHDPRFADASWITVMVKSWSSRDRREALMDTAFGLRRPDASVAVDLGRIGVPALVASGRQDVQFPWQNAQAAAGSIPGARFAVIENAGHFPMVEQPLEVAHLISGFLSPSDSR
jgi:pimeloyl-ACP methyl ester carboxylesterase